MQRMASVLHTNEGIDALGLGGVVVVVDVVDVVVVVVVVVVVAAAGAGFCRCNLCSSLIGNSTAGIVSLLPQMVDTQLKEGA